ncbi:MAG: hypothetical protein M1820_000782 [Bogoriella megaspora]|nr:MAG: hypothetical protein M1820_000782 [Bogoriella megaspora]
MAVNISEVSPLSPIVSNYWYSFVGNSRPFGFQDAWYGAFSPSTSTAFNIPHSQPDILLLNEQGCGTGANGTGPKNCTAACQDPTLVWGNMNTMQNCMLYPVISSMLALPNLTDYAKGLSRSYGFEDASNENLDLNDITNTIANCINEYCATANCTAPGDDQIWNTTGPVPYLAAIPFPDRTADYSSVVAKQLANGTSVSNVSAFKYFWCDDVEDITTAPPDLGGPGVFAAYLIQIGLTFVAYVARRFFNSWVRNICFWWFPLPFVGPLYWRTRASGVAGGWKAANKPQQRLIDSDQYSAYSQFLVDFHKAQCFFMLPVQIAALIAVFSPSNRNYFEARTYQQLVDNVALLSSIAWNGIVPVTFVQYLLHLEGKGEWYTYLLSIGVATLSAITYYRSNLVDIDQKIVAGESPTLQSCGGKPPIQYCYKSNSEIVNRSIHAQGSLPALYGSWGYVSILCFVILILLFFDLLKIFRRRRPQEEGDENSMTLVQTNNKKINVYYWIRDWALSHPLLTRYDTRVSDSKFPLHVIGLRSRFQVVETIFWIFRFAIDIMFLCSLAYAAFQLSLYYRPITRYLFWYDDADQQVHVNGKPESWTFGQIIAVMIWAPVVVDWVVATIWGVEKTYRYRIPRPFTIIKTDNNRVIVEAEADLELGKRFNESSGADLSLLSSRTPKRGTTDAE